MSLSGALTALGIRTFADGDSPDLAAGGLSLSLADVDALLQAAGVSTVGKKVASVRAWNSLNQSITSGVDLTLALDSEDFDSDGMHDPAVNNSRITFKTAGIYVVHGGVSFQAGAGGSIRYVYFRKNGATNLAVFNSPSLGAVQSPSVQALSVLQVAVNDYVELRAGQDSGGALNAVGAQTLTWVEAWKLST